YNDSQGSPTKFFMENVVFKILSEFGITCKLVKLEGVKEEDLATPTGYLRSKGWQLVITFDEKTGGATTVKALQAFCSKLKALYGKKAFRYFSNINMHVLTEG
ncbi:MAG: hypothetical protein JSV58_00715, partial [Candidatus Bathyarchaeota archaeon]